MIKKTLLIAALALATFQIPSFVGTANAANPKLNFCSGAKGGVYDYTAEVLKQQLSGTVDVVNVNTAGSWENLQKISSGACDAGMTQSDALYLYNAEEPNSLNLFALDSLYTEYVHLLCNRTSGVSQFSDLTKKTTVFSGGRGTGADVSLRGLIRADTDHGYASFKDVPISNEGGAGALVKLNGGAAACMVYVGAPGSKFISGDASKFGDNLILVPVVDKYFYDTVYTDKNGKNMSVWSKVTLPASAYSKLMPTGWFGSNKGVDTVGVQAVAVISSAWATTNADKFGDVGLAIPDVKNIVRSTKNLQ